MQKKIITKYIPLLFLISLLITLSIHYFSLVKLNGMDISSELNSYYHMSHGDRNELTDVLPQVNDKTVVVLGTSTLIVPGTCDKKKIFKGSFPELLKNELVKNKISLINLAHCGDDSTSIYGAVDTLLKNKKPRAFLFFFGHSDFTNVSREILHRKTNLIDNDFFLNSLRFVSASMKFRLNYFLGNTFEPALIKLYRIFDKNLFDKNIYAKYAGQIAAHLDETTVKILKRCREENVPVIFFVPIGNLMSPPVAADNVVQALYEKGIKEKNLVLLENSAELDFFGYDQRSKKSVREIFLSKKADDVMVIDLYSDFMSRDTNFFTKSFSDVFHLTEYGHKYVFEKMKKEGILDFISGRKISFSPGH